MIACVYGYHVSSQPPHIPKHIGLDYGLKFGTEKVPNDDLFQLCSLYMASLAGRIGSGHEDLHVAIAR